MCLCHPFLHVSIRFLTQTLPLETYTFNIISQPQLWMTLCPPTSDTHQRWRSVPATVNRYKKKTLCKQDAAVLQCIPGQFQLHLKYSRWVREGPNTVTLQLPSKRYHQEKSRSQIQTNGSVRTIHVNCIKSLIAYSPVAQSFVHARNKICWIMFSQLFVRLLPHQWPR